MTANRTIGEPRASARGLHKPKAYAVVEHETRWKPFRFTTEDTEVHWGNKGRDLP